MASIDEQISRYEEALDRLADPAERDIEAAALQTLVARDTIDRALNSQDFASFSAVATLAKSDRRLEQLASKVDENVDPDTLKSWRQALNPDESAWWWSLDDLTAARERKRIWTVISIFLLMIAAYFIVDTFNLLRTISENPISTGGALVQAILALIAASVFTDAGRQRFVNAFSRLGKRRREFKGAARMILTALVLGATLLIWKFLPAGVAWYFRREANRFQTEGLLQRSIQAYQQASLLQPYSIPTHLSLAKAAERANDFDKAIAEYKSTIILYERTQSPDDSYYEARINLARLLIQHEKNYSKALQILDKPETIIAGVTPQNRELYTYFVFTYRGWANVELNKFSTAYGELGAALQRRPNGASATYLLGRVVEAMQQEAQAKRQWTRFLTILQNDPKQTEEILSEWVSDAQQKNLGRKLQ